MQSRRNVQIKWWQPVALLALLVAFGISASGALAGKPTVSRGASPDRAAPIAVDAFAFLQPGQAGTCPAPPNGGTTQVGCTFVLDLMVNAGTNAAPNGLTAQQSYLTFTYQLIQNARVSTIGSGCTITSTATADNVEFDAALQNEVCNGPGNCTFRGVTVGPGSFGYASGALNNCPEGCPDDTFPNPVFRVAQVGICASNPGTAVLHWQFSPPAPPTRDSELVAFDGSIVSDNALYIDYVIVVQGTGVSPTPTNTVAVTNTNTPVPTNTSTTAPTNTRTNTPVPTNTNTVAPTNTNTAVPTNTGTSAPTNTNTNTPVPTNTGTVAPTNTRTNTPIPTNTSTAVPSATVTNTSAPTNTRTNTPVPTNTNTVAPTNTNTPVPTNTGTVAPTNTRTNTAIPTNTSTGVPSATVTNTSAPTNTRTNTAVPTITNTAAPTNTRTNTAVPTNTNTPAPPTNTNTPAPPTDTNTPAPPTNTPVPGTATSTPSGTCTHCHLQVRDVTITCNPDGSIHWTAVVRNQNQGCTTVADWHIDLQGKAHGNDSRDEEQGWNVLQTQNGTTAFPPGETTLSGDFSHVTQDVDRLRADFKIDDPEDCHASKKSNQLDLCEGAHTSFSDVPASHSAYNAIMSLVKAGALSGYADHTFRPGNNATRGEFAKAVVIALRLPVQRATGHFSDVAASHPLAAYIETLYSRGLMSGYADGTFRPNNNITRAQAAKVIVQAAGISPLRSGRASFSDVPAGSALYGYVEAARANHLTVGYADATFRPNNNATRGQISTALANLLGGK